MADEWQDITPEWTDITPTGSAQAAPTIGTPSISEGSTQTNAPAPAENDSELPFGEQLMMALAEKPASQMKYLQTMYGKENVRVGERGFEFNDGTTWRPAKAGFMANLVASAPEIAGSTVGAAGGGLLGALGFNPLTVGAGVVGGRAVGGALAHAIKEWGVEKMGLKSEEDIRSATDIMATDTIMNLAIDAAMSNPVVRIGTLGAAGLGAGYGYMTAEQGEEAENAMKYGAAGAALGLAGSTGYSAVRGTVNAIREGGVSNLGGRLITKSLDVIKRDLVENAKALASVTPGTKEEDWLVLNRSKEDAKNIVQMTNDVRAFQNSAAKGETAEVLDPSAKEMVVRTGKLMEGVKARVNRLFDNDKALLEASEAYNAKEIPVDELFGSYANKLAKAGLLTVDEQGNYAIRRGIDASGGEIGQIANSADLNALDQVLQQMNALKRAHSRPVQGSLETGGMDKTVKLATETFLPVKKALQFRRMIDDVLESRNAFSGGQDAVGSQAAGLLKQLRGDIVDQATTAVKDIPVGRTPTNDYLYAGDVMKRMNNMYTTFRDQFDSLALPSRLGKDENALNTVDRMLDRKGATILNTFSDLIENAAQGDMTILNEGRKHIQRLQQLRASRNFASTIAKSTGLGNVVKSKLGANPYDMMQASARRVQNRLTPATPQSKVIANGWARGNQMVKGLSPKEKLQMVQTPALREFLKTIYGSAAEYDMTQEALINGSAGQ